MYFVYVIQNELNKIYIGQTNNLQNRIDRHNGKLITKTKTYTRGNHEWHYIYVEGLQTRTLAIEREKQLKSSRGRAFIKTLL